MSLFFFADTSANNLDILLVNLLVAGGDDGATVKANTSGAKKIPFHVDQASTPGTSHATNLASLQRPKGFLVLQDQSQIPSLYGIADYWASLEQTAVLRQAMPPAVDLILFQTWGRKLYDQNVALNHCYADMQHNLQEGYQAYRDAALQTGVGNVYIAPVGSAFELIHDRELCAPNSPPSCDGQGNTGVSQGCDSVEGSYFEKLYTSDGSHPSIYGSYLAACVLYAVLTGKSPVGLPTTGGLPLQDALELQTVATAIVLDDVVRLGYEYPWSASTTTSSSSLAPTRTSAPTTTTPLPTSNDASRTLGKNTLPLVLLLLLLLSLMLLS